MDRLENMESKLDILYDKLEKTTNTIDRTLIQSEIDFYIFEINSILLPIVGFSPQWVKFFLYDTNPAN